MKCCYRRLKPEEREEISRQLAKRASIREIAKRIGRAASTISRKIRKGSCSRYLYRAHRAQNRAWRNSRHRRKGKRKLLMRPDLRQYVHDKLRLRWSPEQIAQVLSKEYPFDKGMRLSHEAIYGYLYVLPRGKLRCV